MMPNFLISIIGYLMTASKSTRHKNLKTEKKCKYVDWSKDMTFRPSAILNGL